jgi:hypothetical protein
LDHLLKILVFLANSTDSLILRRQHQRKDDLTNSNLAKYLILEPSTIFANRSLTPLTLMLSVEEEIEAFVANFTA